jgi:hypothetical protein
VCLPCSARLTLTDDVAAALLVLGRGYLGAVQRFLGEVCYHSIAFLMILSFASS